MSPAAFLIVGTVSGVASIAAGPAMLKRLKWGRKRWPAVVGTLLASTGAASLLTALAISEVSIQQEFRARLATVGPGLLEDLTQGSLLFGAASALSGALLIAAQQMLGPRQPRAPGRTTA